MRRNVRELFELASHGESVAIGLDSCLWAGSVSALGALFIREGAVHPGYVCDRSRWLSSTAGRCPVCGDAMRLTADVIDELSDHVIEEGGSVHHVHEDAGLREHLAAGVLRFALPTAPWPPPGSGRGRAPG